MLQLLSFEAGRLFSEADYCIILSHYLQLLAGVFEQSTGKQFCRSFFLISQYPFTLLIKAQTLSCGYYKTVKNTIFTKVFKTPDSLFMKHV